MENQKFICYNTEAEFEADYAAGAHTLPYIAKTLDDGQMHYVEESWTSKALKVKSLSSYAGTINITAQSIPDEAITITYSTDSGVSWSAVSQSSTSAIRLDLAAGGETWIKASATVPENITCEADHHVYGDIAAFVPSLANWKGLFKNDDGLISVDEDLLPAKTMTANCYEEMFSWCKSLKEAPALPATELADYCYSKMFYECQKLVTCPALPAKTMASHCYEYMFYGDFSLQSPPNLSATELAEYCYAYMFANCTGLYNAPTLGASTLKTQCYRYMFYNASYIDFVRCMATDLSASDATSGWLAGVSSTGTFIKASGVSWTTGSSGIPSGWTVYEN